MLRRAQTKLAKFHRCAVMLLPDQSVHVTMTGTPSIST
jgi:hypothetical protein